MMKLVKHKIKPIMMPDCWKVQGRAATAVPIMVFQQLKMMTIELSFSSELAVSEVEGWLTDKRGKLTKGALEKE